MTIETLSDNTLRVTMPAKLTAGDVTQLAQQLDGLIAKAGRIKLLMDLTNFGGWENMEAFGAHMDQFKFVHERIQHVDRIAVITANPWQQQLFQAITSMLPTQAMAFDKGQEAAAQAWLSK
jgi:SpoIIAA-like